MKKIALAIAAVLAIGTGAANASPIIVLSGNPAPAFGAGGLSDNFAIFSFVPGNPPVTTVLFSFGLTEAQESNCANPFGGGCATSSGGGIPAGIAVNVANSNLFTVIYDPDGEVSDLFGISCNERDANGRCAGSGELAFVSRLPGGPGLDLTALPANTAIGWTGTEGTGAGGTSFNAFQYLDISQLPTPHPVILANFVSSNDVPEPATITLFGTALAGAAAIRRRRKNDKAA